MKKTSVAIAITAAVLALGSITQGAEAWGTQATGAKADITWSEGWDDRGTDGDRA